MSTQHVTSVHCNRSEPLKWLIRHEGAHEGHLGRVFVKQLESKIGENQFLKQLHDEKKPSTKNTKKKRVGVQLEVAQLRRLARITCQRALLLTKDRPGWLQNTEEMCSSKFIDGLNRKQFIG